MDPEEHDIDHRTRPEMVHSASDKKAFFHELERGDCLVEDSGADADEGFDRLIALSRNYVEPVPYTSPGGESSALAVNSPSRSSSLGSRQRGDASVIVIEDARASTIKESNTMGTLKNKADVYIGKKRCAPTLKLVPEQQQIFKGLVFFFFPNSVVSPLRRLRIQRAQEYGALWARTWGDNVTHVIVDKGLAFQEVLKYLCLEI